MMKGWRAALFGELRDTECTLWRSSQTQVIILGFVFFCLPGMWNGINSMSGGIGGTSSYSTATAALYGCFTVVALLAPALTSLAGPKLALALGSFGYILFTVALLTYNSTGGGFLVAAGAITGICAGILWQAQGMLIMSYPSISRKGVLLGIFWSVFNLGGVVGGLITLLTNLSNGKDHEASSSTYWAYISIMVLGTITIVFGLVRPCNVQREDGSTIQLDTTAASLANVKNDVVGAAIQFSDPRMILLAPLFFVSNWFYTYHFTVFNGSLFTTRTQGLNNIGYWFSQMIAAMLLGRYLDKSRSSLKIRASLGLIVTAVLTAGCWGGLAAVQYMNPLLSGPNHVQARYDFGSTQTSYYVPLYILYFFCGSSDALIQVLSYWIMGMMSDDPKTLGRMSGFYKCLQSAGAAISWGLGGADVATSTQLWVNVGLFFPALAVAGIAIVRYMPTEKEQRESMVIRRFSSSHAPLIGSGFGYVAYSSNSAPNVAAIAV